MMSRWGNLSGGGRKLVRTLGIGALVLVGVIGIPKLLKEAGISGDPWTFEETLPEAVDDFGDDAKVSSISVNSGSVSFNVIGTDGVLHTRDYVVESENVRGQQGQQATGLTRKTNNSERPATPAEVQGAVLALGELDRDVVNELWEEADFPDSGSSAALTGTEWALGSGVRPFDKYVASADGSHFRQVESQVDSPPTSLEEAKSSGQATAACVQAAGQDIAALQKCVAQ